MVKSDNIVDFGRWKNSGESLVAWLYREHQSAIRGFLITRIGRVPEIEDVLQDLFAKLAQAPDLERRFSSGTGISRSYLLTVANNILVDMHRKQEVRWRFQKAESGKEGEASVSTERLALDHEVIRSVESSLKQMPRLWRQSFVLSRFEGLKYTVIAAKLGLAPKTVETYIAKAMMKIRNDIERKGLEWP